MRSADIHLPLDELLLALATDGLRSDVSTHLRLRRYLAAAARRADPPPLDVVKYQLAALLCQSPAEQTHFYEVFDAFAAPYTAVLESLPEENDEPFEQPSFPPPADLSYPAPPPAPVEPVKPQLPAPARPAPPPTKTTGRSGPIRIELTFPVQQFRAWNTVEIDQALRPLREKEWTTVQEWDIQRSIEETIRAGGIPHFATRRRKKAPQYLLLIDQKSPRDHLAGLYADLVAELQRRDLDVAFYYYSAVPYRCWSDPRDPQTYTSIESLQSAYAGYKLLLVGDVDGLLDLPDLRPSNLAFDLHDNWHDVAMLCPKSTADWGEAERALCPLFPVVPANAAGISTLVQQWSATEVFTPYYWKAAYPEPALPLFSPDAGDEGGLEKDMEGLYYYLGEPGFQWLCATAVYPELYWELTKLLRDPSISPDGRLSESDQNRQWQVALLRLGRVGWFRQGHLPTPVRTYLSKYSESQMPQERGRAIRDQLLEVLGMAENEPPPGSYAAAYRASTIAWYEHERALAAPHLTTAERARIEAEFREKGLAKISLRDIEDAIGRKLFEEIQEELVWPAVPEEELFQVLWVDDEPWNNDRFQKETVTANLPIRFINVLSTEEALQVLTERGFHLIISDIGRGQDGHAGIKMMQTFKEKQVRTPVVFSTTPSNVKLYRYELIYLGAAEVFTDMGLLRDFIVEKMQERDMRGEEDLRTMEALERNANTLEISFTRCDPETLPESVELYPGDKLDRFEVLEKLGEGAFGSVYKVSDVQSGRVSALKVLKSWTFINRVRVNLIKRFELEFETQIRSNYLVQSTGYGCIKGNPFILMEFCSNKDLRNQIQKHKFSEQEIRDLLHDVLQGLHDLHSNGKTHRNLKPENILLTADGQAKLTDFGIFGYANTALLKRMDWLEYPAEIVFNSHCYMPLERLDPGSRKETILPTIDIFAVGVILYEMFTGGDYPFGRPPQDEEGFANHIRRLREGQWYDPRTHNPGISDFWIETIEHCLYADYKKRYQSAAELLQRLELFGKDNTNELDNREEEHSHYDGLETSSTYTMCDPDIVPQRVEFDPGDTFGRFEVLEKLGEGTYGSVYKVKDSQRHVVSAVKIFKIWSVSTPDRVNLLERIKRGFETGQIESDYLVRSIDSGCIRGNQYIEMEFCPNKDLLNQIQNHPLSEQAIHNFSRDILQGLHALHSNGRIHRDLKPENILLSANGGVKLTDFNIVGHINSSRLTSMDWRGRPKEVFGTYAYMPPEQQNPRNRNQTILPTIDIFALGVIIYEMFTGGHYPFGELRSEKDLATYLRRRQAGEWDDPRMYNPDISDFWAQTIYHCLNPDYKLRYQTAEEVLRRLSEIPAPAAVSSPMVQREDPKLEKIASKRLNNRYELQRELGHGGFSTVWLAWDEINQSEVAVKVFMRQDEEGVRRCKEEFDFTNRMHHNRIIRSFEFFVDEDKPCIVMPYYNNTLQDRMGQINERMLWKVISDIGSALNYIHSLKIPILHNDLKPEGFLIKDDGSFVLTDFGISTELTEKLGIFDQDDSSVLVKGIGPRAYRAPELFQYGDVLKRNATTSSDIWAFGACLFELATGEPPFGDQGGMYLLMQHKDYGKTVPELVSEPLASRFSPEIVGIIYRCLSFQPSDRPTARQLIEEAELYLRNNKYNQTILGVRATARATTFLRHSFINSIINPRPNFIQRLFGLGKKK